MIDRVLSHRKRSLRGLRSPREQKAFLERVHRHGKALVSCSDQGIADLARSIRETAAADGWLNTDNVSQVFAMTREAAARAIGKRHYDVQIIAGHGLLCGAVVEMATGEGKTLAATLPVVVRALQLGSVHLMTVNPYLAERDFREMRPIYQFLGITCGLLRPDSGPEEKRDAYAREITYGVGTEFGFDYLRDQMAIKAREPAPGGRFRSLLRGASDLPKSTVQESHRCAIVDEADSVMIDEARTALILSGSTGRPAVEWTRYEVAGELAERLEMGVHFRVHAARNTLELLEPSRELIAISGQRVAESLQRPWRRYVEQALRARHLLHRDQHYVVQDDRIQIIDEFTGRRLEDRTWSEGLHQAVETLEGVTVTEESDARLRISRQRYLGFYDHLSGMTGTALGCERELDKLFGLDVLPVPPRNPSQRVLLPACCFGSAEAKWKAITSEVADAQARRQPVLIGTRTVQGSERLAAGLKNAKLPHVVLNARQDREEAEIIALAGQPGRITVATNLAGRGADIPLGEGVESLGGLLVIAAEPNESARIDRQLAGRCARQGQPGSYRLYVSADDDLVVRHAPDLARRMRSGADGAGRCHDDHSAVIRRVQDRLDGHYYRQRQTQYELDQRLLGVLEKAG